jgi:Uri superfamily endonuclease
MPGCEKIFETTNVPSAQGTYALLLNLPRAIHLRVGKFGAYRFPQGDYVYVGSAFGPGGLRARITRHLATN